MSTPNQPTPIDEALAGMVLAEPVLDGGSVLLPAGATLSDSTLASLRRRGIDTVHISIAAPAGEDSEVVSPEQQALRLASLFRASSGIGATDLLRALIQSHRESV